MWLSFLYALVVGIIIVFLPGFFILKALHADKAWALATAALVSLGTYFLCAEILALLRFHTSALVLVSSILCISAAIWLISCRLKRQKDAQAPEYRAHKIKDTNTTESATRSSIFSTRPHIASHILCSYLGVGALTSCVFFLCALQTPDCMAQGWDVVSHLNYAQTMIQNHQFTSLHPSFYAASEQTYNPSTFTTTFYPAGWNMLLAFIMEITSVPATICANALNALFVGLVFPLSLMSFIAQVFGAQSAISHDGRADTKEHAQPTPQQLEHVLFCGSLLSGVCCIFPWALLVYGPLFPFVSATCLMPSIFWIFMELVRSRMRAKKRLSLFLLFLIGGIALVELHTTTLFASIVMLTPWCIARIVHTRVRIHIGEHVLPSILLALLFLACVLCAWVFLYYVLIMGPGSLHFWWKSYSSIQNSLIQLLFFEFVGSAVIGNWFVVPQPVLTLLLCIGAVVSCIERRGRFLLVALGLFSFMCVLTISSDLALKGILSGFWYTDPYRIAALAAVCALPLIAYGMAAVFEKLEYYWMQLFYAHDHKKGCEHAGASSSKLDTSYVAHAVFAALFVIAMTTIPFPDISSIAKDPLRALGTNGLLNHVKVIYAGYHDPRFVDAKKEAFMQEAKTIVGDDVVLNDPFDGSVLGYGFYRLHTWWRYCYNLEEFEHGDALRIRIEADKRFADESIRHKMDATGARWVIKLGNERNEDASLLAKYTPELFCGIARITPETPGYTLVLKENDMELYRID